MYFDAYPMVISSNGKDSFTFKSSDINRTLTCPKKNLEKRLGKYYRFDKTTCVKYGWGSFKFVDPDTKTNAILARRLWDSLWEEGWR